MDAFMIDFADRLSAMHTSINKAIEGLPAEALNWVPGPEMNSLAVLIAHTAGSERFWIGDIAGLEPSDRNRAAEFQTIATSPADLSALLDTALAHSQSVFGRLTRDDLTVLRDVPGRERPLSVGWALLHALEHVAVHTGHIELTRQFWDLRQAA